MSGFSPEWLALREGADHRAINHTVRRHLLAHLSAEASVNIADLGCGTGSNFRALAPEITARQLWLLVDNDAELLQLAAAMTREIAAASDIEVGTMEADLAAGALQEIAAHSDLVTAAAFFDLVTPDFIDALADTLADADCAFYTTLTYDGIAAWLPNDPLNGEMLRAFNAHQRTDKGFGPAAGPEASRLLKKAFADRGYRVLAGKSPWVLDAPLTALRQEADRGWAAAVVETGAVTAKAAAAWLFDREADPEAVTLISHEDVLALPPE